MLAPVKADKQPQNNRRNRAVQESVEQPTPPPPVCGQTPNAPGGRADLQPPQTGFRCCPMFLVGMLSPTTPAKRIEHVVRIVRSVPAFPQSRQGRPSPRVFRGRLGVHACYGLPTCRHPDAAFFLPGFDHFVTSIAAGIATRPGRPLPGQDFHLFEQRTLSRHTWTNTPAVFLPVMNPLRLA